MQQVVDLCDEVIGCGQYSLLSNYENLFIYDYKDNAEQILALRWPDPLLLTDQTRWGNGNTLVATLTAGDMSDVGGWGGNLSASPDMIDLYNEDPEDQSRLKRNFLHSLVLITIISIVTRVVTPTRKTGSRTASM